MIIIMCRKEKYVRYAFRCKNYKGRTGRETGMGEKIQKKIYVNFFLCFQTVDKTVWNTNITCLYLYTRMRLVQSYIFRSTRCFISIAVSVYMYARPIAIYFHFRLHFISDVSNLQKGITRIIITLTQHKHTHMYTI